MARRAKTFLPPAAKLDATVVLWGKGEKFYRVCGGCLVRSFPGEHRGDKAGSVIARCLPDQHELRGENH